MAFWIAPKHCRLEGKVLWCKAMSYMPKMCLYDCGVSLTTLVGSSSTLVVIADIEIPIASLMECFKESSDSITIRSFLPAGSSNTDRSNVARAATAVARAVWTCTIASFTCETNSLRSSKLNESFPSGTGIFSAVPESLPQSDNRAAYSPWVY